MAATLQTILEDIGAYLDQDTTLPTGTELTVRVNLVNQAVREWGNSYQWKQLQKNSVLTFALSGTSVGFPANFKKLMSPVYDITQTVDNEYVEIDPDDRFDKNSTDKYLYTGGNDSSGKYLVINPAMVSGASLIYTYQSFPSSLGTLADTAEIPDSSFLVKRTIAQILSSRSDQRFPLINSEADNSLSNMIEEEATFSGGQNNRTPDWTRKTNFRLGRDG